MSVELLAAVAALAGAVAAGTVAHELAHVVALGAFEIPCTVAWLHEGNGSLAAAVGGRWATVTPDTDAEALSTRGLRVAAVMPLTLAAPLALIAVGFLPDPTALGTVPTAATIGPTTGLRATPNAIPTPVVIASPTSTAIRTPNTVGQSQSRHEASSRTTYSRSASSRNSSSRRIQRSAGSAAASPVAPASAFRPGSVGRVPSVPLPSRSDTPNTGRYGGFVMQRLLRVQTAPEPDPYRTSLANQPAAPATPSVVASRSQRW